METIKITVKCVMLIYKTYINTNKCNKIFSFILYDKGFIVHDKHN